VLAKRDALSEAERRSSSARIVARLLDLPAYRSAGRVLAYLSFGSEFDTAAVVNDVRAGGKTLVLPRVQKGSRSLALHEVHDLERDIEAGVWGIRQPRAVCAPIADGRSIDFVVVPGVAFTRQGARLGYGGGYYDRFIAALSPRPPLIAAAFEMQVVDELPMSDTDQRVDLVITERAEYSR